MKNEPLVLCLTNTVAANFTANCLLAIGAKPAMVEEPAEAAELAGVADALLINLGTVHARQAEAMRAAIRVANERRIPWVLDPVGVQFLSYRKELALEFIASKPTIIRGNHAEIKTLMGTVPKLNRREDAPATGSIPEDAPATGSVPEDAPITLSTGVVDRIIDDSGSVEIGGGVELLQTVTATGCAQGGLCAALLGRGLSPREAAIYASKLMKAAGERAGTKAKTPGSFQIALIDALWEIEHD